MSLKELLGLSEAGIADFEIARKLREAQKNNLDAVEFNVNGDIVKISLPHIGFDPEADKDSW